MRYPSGPTPSSMWCAISATGDAPFVESPTGRAAVAIGQRRAGPAAGARRDGDDDESGDRGATGGDDAAARSAHDDEHERGDQRAGPRGPGARHGERDQHECGRRPPSAPPTPASNAAAAPR